MPVPYKPKPKSTNMGEKIVKTEVRKAQMSKPTPKPKSVSEADKKKAELLKKKYEERKYMANFKENSANTLTKQPRIIAGKYKDEKAKAYKEDAAELRRLARYDSLNAVRYNPDVFKKKK